MSKQFSLVWLTCSAFGYKKGAVTLTQLFIFETSTTGGRGRKQLLTGIWDKIWPRLRIQFQQLMCLFFCTERRRLLITIPMSHASRLERSKWQLRGDQCCPLWNITRWLIFQLGPYSVRSKTRKVNLSNWVEPSTSIRARNKQFVKE